MYKLMEGGYILRLSDGLVIPPTTFNVDYVVYLDWLAAGGVPLQIIELPPIDPHVFVYGAVRQALSAQASEFGFNDIDAACAFASLTPQPGSAERFRLLGVALQDWTIKSYGMAFDMVAQDPTVSSDVVVSAIPLFLNPTTTTT